MKKFTLDKLCRWPLMSFKSVFKASLAILLLCLFSQQSFAFGYFALPVSGTVSDEKGAPLAGASILEKGTSNTILTKTNGSFTINVSNDKAVLVISFVGYNQQEIAVNNSKTLSITLSS